MAGTFTIDLFPAQLRRDEPGVVQLAGCCSWFCKGMYNSPHVLAVQVVLSLVMAQFCYWYPKGKPETFTFWTIILLSLVANGIYLAGFVKTFKKRHALKKWVDTQVPVWCYYQLSRVVGVIGILRAFVFISDVLGENKRTFTSYSACFFFFGYFHVVSMTKIFRIKDVLCLADSLLAVGVMICAVLDGEKDEYGQRYWLRISFLYLFAGVLVFFRFAPLPHGQEEELPRAAE